MLESNRHRRHGWQAPPLTTAPRALHRQLPGYEPTPLRRSPELAEQIGVRELWLKDDAERFGLPSFKALGASWAVWVLLAERYGLDPAQPDPDELRSRLSGEDLTLACATDGNHGRAVAWMARLLGVHARVLVPRGTAPARIDAIAGEGARVEQIDGDYDEAIARSAELQSDSCIVISDTAWPGYEKAPRAVIEGYATMFAELDEQLGGESPDVVLVPIGVGALAAAAATHFRRGAAEEPRLVGVEPDTADCLLRSIRAGQPVSVPGPHPSVMAGLNCGTPSPLAWPLLRDGFDDFMAISDDVAREGMRLLAGVGLERGEVPGGVVGAARELGADHSVLLLITEAVTDPEHYAQVTAQGGWGN